MTRGPRLILTYLNTRWTLPRHRLKSLIEVTLILPCPPTTILSTAYHDLVYSHLTAPCIFGTLIARI